MANINILKTISYFLLAIGLILAIVFSFLHNFQRETEPRNNTYLGIYTAGFGLMVIGVILLVIWSVLISKQVKVLEELLVARQAEASATTAMASPMASVAIATPPYTIQGLEPVVIERSSVELAPRAQPTPIPSPIPSPIPIPTSSKKIFCPPTATVGQITPPS